MSPYEEQLRERQVEALENIAKHLERIAEYTAIKARQAGYDI